MLNPAPPPTEPERPARSVPIVVHRAAGGYLVPENTLAGLQGCIDLRCEWAEVDVRRTGDGHHVLMHDDTLERTTDGRGPVADVTLEYVRTLKTASDAGVPTLPEALDFARGRLRLYLDCRDVETDRLLREIREARMLSDVLVCTDVAVATRSGKTNEAQLPLVEYFDGDHADLLAAAGDHRASVLEVPGPKITPALIDAARAVGLAIGCLALGPHDNLTTWQRILRLDVAWIMTDYPDQLRREMDSLTG